MKLLINCAALVSIVFLSHHSLALDSTQILPTGIYSPAYRYGLVDGISDRFDSGGQLKSLTALYSQTFDSNKINSLGPKAQELINALNTFGTDQLGNQLNLGTLIFESQPLIQYSAPILAYGVTVHWTVAVAVPWVHYSNKVTLRETGGNAALVHKQVRGVSEELDQAFQMLEKGLAPLAQSQLNQWGYKSISDREESFLGDIQLVSLHRYVVDAVDGFLVRSTLALPTGPRPDADDLLSLDIFGRTSIEEALIIEKNFFRRLGSYFRVSWKKTFDQAIEYRPSLGADKQTVVRKFGDQWMLGTQLNYYFNDLFSLSSGLEWMTKAEDSVLGKSQEGIKLIAGCNYTTVSSYFKGATLLPYMVGYEISEYVSGRNIEPQLRQDLTLTMFF